MVYALYVASVLGAVSLLLMMPRQGFNPRKLGALLGAATLGGLWLYLAPLLPAAAPAGGTMMVYYYVFSALAVASAVRVITHEKPVFSALWFVMLVLASAGLLLLLDAEFVAFAMVIIYGGAILVTYVFVIMLASQSGDPAAETATPDYDRVAREPAAAIAAGFLLLALFLSVFFSPLQPNPARKAADDATVRLTLLTNRSVDRMENEMIGQGTPLRRDAVKIENVERVGLDLFQNHPLGLELAGVILLVSLVGAVIIARQRVEEPAAQQP